MIYEKQLLNMQKKNTKEENKIVTDDLPKNIDEIDEITKKELETPIIYNETISQIIHNKNIIKNVNKKTKEEIKEANRLYKQKQREKMKEKYGNEEYKKKRAQEIADSRSKKEGKKVYKLIYK
jgi:hypothetical protein